LNKGLSGIAPPASILPNRMASQVLLNSLLLIVALSIPIGAILTKAVSLGNAFEIAVSVIFEAIAVSATIHNIAVIHNYNDLPS
jgi:hypothetical protein